jgi:hypothetical protein
MRPRWMSGRDASAVASWGDRIPHSVDNLRDSKRCKGFDAAVRILALSSRVFCKRAWRLRHSRQQRRWRGRRGFSDPLGRLHERGENADEVVTARSEKSSGIPQRVWGFSRMPQAASTFPIRANYAQWCSAFLRMTPGGLTWLSTAGGSSRFHGHALACARTNPPEEDPCDARQARRNHSTSAAAFISRVRDKTRPPLPAHALLRGAKRPVSEARTRAVYVRAEGAGINFFEDSEKWLGVQGKTVA